MTHPIDTSPEAIAALLDGVTPGPWMREAQTIYANGGYQLVASMKPREWGQSWPQLERNGDFIAAAREPVPALAAEIARLTAAVNELETIVTETETRAQDAIAQVRAERGAALIRAERSERCEVAAHDAANTAIRQRDDARALVAMAFEAAASRLETTDAVLSTLGDCTTFIRVLTPTDATAALARRDASMRNEGRRQAAKIAADYCFARTTNSGALKSPAVFTSHTWQDIRDAILAALEPEGGE